MNVRIGEDEYASTPVSYSHLGDTYATSLDIKILNLKMFARALAGLIDTLKTSNLHMTIRCLGRSSVIWTQSGLKIEGKIHLKLYKFIRTP